MFNHDRSSGRAGSAHSSRRTDSRSPRVSGGIKPIESLEKRLLFSADGIDMVEAGFVQVSWQGQETWARPGEWVVQMEGLNGSPEEQLAAASRRVKRAGRSLEAVRHLGGDGAVLVKAGPNVTPAQAKRQLNQANGVQSAEPNFALTIESLPNDTRFSTLWGLNNSQNTDIDAPEAWDLTTGSRTTVVGVIDTGLDYRHPDIYQNVWINQAEIPADRASSLTDVDRDGLITFFDLNNSINQGAGKVTDTDKNRVIDGQDLLAPVTLGGWADGADAAGDLNSFADDLIGWNFKSGTNDPMDDQGHGTHVSGTIAAHGNNGTGITGVNWAAQVMALKFLGADGSGTSADAIAALNYATEMRQSGVDIGVTNNSYGGDPYSSVFHNALVQNRDSGMLFVAAAGNGDWLGRAINNDSTPFYPASYNTDDSSTTADEDNVISVAASDSSDNKASWSNYGATSVDLAAPGVDINSLAHANRDYRYNSGTSMAAPHVAGVAALVSGLSPSATHVELRSSLLAGVDQLDSLTGLVATGGRLDARGAISSLGLSVIGSSPDSTHNTLAAPKQFTVRFSDAVIGVDAADFAVTSNGATVPAQNVAVATDARSAVFSYDTSPIITNGTHEMSIAAGSIARTDGAPLVGWTEQFTSGTAGAAPVLSAVVASSKSVVLDWTDTAADESSYQVVRTNGSASTTFTLGANATSFTDTSVIANTTYTYTVNLISGGAAVAASNTVTVATGLAEGGGTGLRGDYYDNAGSTSDFTSTVNRKLVYAPKLTRTDDSVNFDWAGGSPSSGIAADTFTVRWTGEVQPRYSGVYTFHTETDDGVRLWVNGQLVVNDWKGHAVVENTGSVTVALEAGKLYPLTLEYFDNTSWAVAKLSWSSDQQPKQLIPTSQLYPLVAKNVAAKSPAATHLSATRVSSGQINLAWTDNTDNESGFKIERSTNGTSWSLLTTVGANVTAYSNTKLRSGTYFYRVRGYSSTVNSSDPLDFSNIASA